MTVSFVENEAGVHALLHGRSLCNVPLEALNGVETNCPIVSCPVCRQMIQALRRVKTSTAHPGKVKAFVHGRYYVVAAPWRDPPNEPRLRVVTIRYELEVGERLRFRGVNLGQAQFTDANGASAFLPPRASFQIFSEIEGESNDPANA